MLRTLRNASLAVSLIFVAFGTMALAQTSSPATTPEEDARDQWWTAWSSCDITPVHSAPEQGDTPAPTDPSPIEFLPWLEAETTNNSDATVVVSLFSNNRPLPVGGSYSDASNAKWLWILSDDLDDLSITATNENGATVEIDTGRVLSSSTGGNEWPSIIDLPEPGCWTFDITAESRDGMPYEGQIVFVAVP